MSDSADSSQQRDVASSKAGKDRRGKVVFALLAVGIALAIYFGYGRGQTLLPNWPTDIVEALAQAKAEDRRVVALFLSIPPDETTTRLVQDTITREPNPQSLSTGRFLVVKVKVGSAAKDAACKRFGVTRLPTLLILGPDGMELNRREGPATLGQTQFSNGFLDLKDVRKAQAPAAGPAGSTGG
jgi:hypothetical protein